MKKTKQLALYIIFILLLIAPSSTCSHQKEQQGTLNLWDAGPITLDPAVSSELSSHTYIMQIFSGLVCLNDELRPVPDIAENWQISQDGKTYTFSIRRGVKFHDGKEVTAQDFKFSWDRACSPGTRSQTAFTYLGDILGVNDVLEGKKTEISGVEVIDDYTIEITIDAPKTYFLSKLSYPTAFVVDRSNTESGREWWRKPNGTGPFKLKEWRTDELLSLEANMLHYREQARINQVDFHLLSGMPMAMYEMDKIDVTPVYEHNINRVMDKKGPFYKELAIFPELSLFYMGFNTQKPPFDDANIRRAFCHAVNKERIIKLTLNGMMTEANRILPPGLTGISEDFQGLEYNVEKARSLISNSKYGSVANLPSITITTSGWGGNISENLGAIIQEWQQNLGVEVTVRQIEPEIFLYNLDEEADEMFMLGWIADYPDPQNFLDNLFRSNTVHNVSKYSNSDVDTLLGKAAIELDDTTRLDLYLQAEQLILDDAPCLPLWFSTNYILVKPHVKNYRIDAMGIPRLDRVYIEN